jgi:hypothetical protein
MRLSSSRGYCAGLLFVLVCSTSGLCSDAVLRWNAVATEAAKIDHGLNYPSQQFGPTRLSRALAIVQIAVYDAVCAIDGTYQSYLPAMTAPSNASLDAAIAQAAHDTLAALYSLQQPRLDQTLATDLAAIPDGPAKTGGIAVGQQAASQILAVRQNDGSDKDAPGQPVNYTYGSQPGQWRADPLHPNVPPLGPDWGSVTPFVLQSGSQFRAPPPPALNSPEYTSAFNEVKTLGGGSPASPTTRTDQETDIGLFWGYDAQPGLCAPIRFYNQIAQIIAIQQGNTEVQNARMFMLANAAMADAAITCWETKYYYNFWRPITAIREAAAGTGPTGLGDGNPNTIGDPNWTPLGAPADNGNGTNFTPPFPGYTSGHATIGTAMFSILSRFYGTDNIPFTVISDEFNTITIDQSGQPRPLMPRSFTSFSEAAYENAISRIYIGVHFQFDMVQGMNAGNEIGNYLFTRIGLRTLNDDQAFITKVYQDMLHRRVDPQGLASWDGQLNQGMTRAQAAQAIMMSPEGLASQVTDLYIKTLHRLPDASGLNTYTTMLAQGGNLTEVEAALIGSQEYFVVRGGGTLNGFLQAAYTDVLNRAPDAAGAAGFSQQLSAGGSRTTVANALLTSPEGREFQVQQMFSRFLRRAPDLAGSNSLSNDLMGGMPDVTAEAGMIGSDEYFNHL